MGERRPIVLVCGQCGRRNYRTTKRRKPTERLLVLKKFCPTCNRHTEHRESK
ncbi:MAG: 50S ribosomal protein L33 [Deltaproteobacteria bacterium]|nr:50S ribosomal protein L33 [Deltaproteobacteria bacterium]